MIKKEEIKHIAKLARLELDEKEIENLQKDMSVILDYFELLKKAPKMETKINSEKTSDGQREDKIVFDQDAAGKIVAQAPDKKGDYYKVRSIF